MAIDREKVLAAAQKFAEKRKYDKAIAEYQKLIEQDQNDARTLLKIGDLQAKMETFGDAVGTYERVGRYYAQQGFALKAIAVYKQIRDIVAKHLPHHEERYAHILPQLGELYQQLGLTADAVAMWDEFATRLQRVGRDAEAVEVLHRLASMDANNPIAHLRLAEAMSRARDIEGASHEFSAAAHLLIKTGRRDDALRVLERLLHLRADPAHAKMAAELYLARAGANDGLQALAKLQICFQANPRDLETLELLARSFLLIQQATKAVEVYKEMARLAKEQGKIDLFSQYVDRLVELAGDDKGVKELLRQSGSMVAAAERAAAEPSVEVDSLEDADVVELEDDAILEEELALSEGSGQLQVLEPSLGEESSRAALMPGAPTSTADSSLEPSRALQDAASYRRAKLFTKAESLLRRVLAAAPHLLDARWSLVEVLVESGKLDDALGELLTLATSQMDRDDNAAAAQTLEYAFQLDPSNAEVHARLRTLGYGGHAAPDVESPSIPDPTKLRSGSEVWNEQDQPLPSFPLEPAQRQPSANAERFDDTDDPFAGAALPSFPLPAESDVALDLVQHKNINEADDPFGDRRTLLRTDAVPIRTGKSGARFDLESVLEEADFFASRGLLQDALVILRDQGQRWPNHPLIVEKVGELEALAEFGEAQLVPALGRESHHELNDFLDEPLQEARTGRTDGYQLDVEAVFANFKAGVTREEPVSEGRSHVDLGVAYKEMGLPDEAIRELKIGANDPDHACVAWSTIGQINAERGQWDGALDAYSRGLNSNSRTAEQETFLSYEIARCYEAQGTIEQAVRYLERVLAIDSSFRDAQTRVERLRRGELSAESNSYGAQDDFDRVFEEMMSRRK